MNIWDIRLEKVKELIKMAGSQVEFANKIKRSPQQVSGWLVQNKRIGEIISRHIESCFDLDPGSLDQPIGQKPLSEIVSLIPIYNLNYFKLPADGFNRTHKDTFPIARIILDELNLKNKDLIILVIHDDSMLPTIEYNHRILVDITDTKIENGKIYALSKNKEIFIRRVFKQIGGNNYEAKSDNEKYGKIDFKPSSKIKVIGRIVYLLGQEL